MKDITKASNTSVTSSPEISDEELGRLVQNGDSEKFGLLMTRYERKLFRYGTKFLSNEDNIEDVVQEVFIKTYRNIKSFDPSQKFSSWIYRIAHNTFVNSMRTISRGPLYFFDFDTLISHPIYEDPIEKEHDQEDIKAMVDQGLNHLKPQYKEILILCYIEELSYKEIADILRIPIGTVGIRLRRAKKTLRASLEKEHQHHGK